MADHEGWHRDFWDRRVRAEERRERRWEKRVHTALVWRTIERYLAGVTTALDAGAGPGRFSLPLARRGLRVTHLDLSPRMVDRAARAAARQGLALDFVVGSVEALPWPDRRFDLVLCLDAPVSYAAAGRRALEELARVTGRWLVLSVVNRLGQLPVGIALESLLRRDLAFSRSFLATGDWRPPPSLARLPFARSLIFPPLHAYTPEELREELEALGLEILEMSATGTLARLVGSRTVKRIWRRPGLREEFLALCEDLERRPALLGVGATSASGLLAVCRPKR